MREAFAVDGEHGNVSADLTPRLGDGPDCPHGCRQRDAENRGHVGRRIRELPASGGQPGFEYIVARPTGFVEQQGVATMLAAPGSPLFDPGDGDGIVTLHIEAVDAAMAETPELRPADSE